MKHNYKNWGILSIVQIIIIIGSFNLPNSIINGATWYAPIIDFGRISLLFSLPTIDAILVTKLISKGKKKKVYLSQFIDRNRQLEYDSIDPIYFVNITPEQINTIEFIHQNREDDLVLDSDLSFNLIQKHLKK